MGEIFRSVHTIKGTTGFLGFKRLEKLAHAGENLLGLLRDGKARRRSPLDHRPAELLDGLRSILKTIETEGERRLWRRFRAHRPARTVATPGQPRCAIRAPVQILRPSGSAPNWRQPPFAAVPGNAPRSRVPPVAPSPDAPVRNRSSPRPPVPRPPPDSPQKARPRRRAPLLKARCAWTWPC
jgi:hypothetical protein